MESVPPEIHFICSDLSITLSWNSEAVSDDIVVESCNKLCGQFLNLYRGSHVQCVDGDGISLTIENVIFHRVSPIFLRIEEAQKPLEPEYEPARDVSSYAFKQKISYEVLPSGALAPPSVSPPVKQNYGNDNKAPFAFMSKGTNQELRGITFAEVKLHNKKEDCWMILDGKVYDVTSYIKSHPGGDIILKAAGRDGTSLFRKYHHWVNAHNLIGKLQIGHLIRQ